MGRIVPESYLFCVLTEKFFWKIKSLQEVDVILLLISFTI